MADDAIKTVVGEIMRIAVEHGYEGTQIKTITGAIDALADTLAGSDVDSGQTVAQAVKALAPYIGGGGGVQLGPLQNGLETTDAVPAVGNIYYGYSAYIESAKAGDTVVFGKKALSSAIAPTIAAGLVVTIKYDFLSEQSPDISAYVITSEYNEDSQNNICTSARQWDGQLDVNVSEPGSCMVTLTMPELDVDNEEVLVIVIDSGSGGGIPGPELHPRP